MDKDKKEEPTTTNNNNILTNTKSEKIKIIIIGDQAVGKSSLLMRYCEDKFTLNMMGTAGVDYKRKIIDINNTKYTILFYDAAGHDRFRHITKTHYQSSQGIILAYDSTELSSFNNVNVWMKNIQENGDSNAEILMLGNKIDLDSKCISLEDAEKLAKEYKVNIVETSAKTGENVDKAFMTLINNIIEKDKKLNNKEDKTININNDVNNKENTIQLDNGKKQKPNNNKNKGGCFKCG